ncbi:MAG: hypothetical protein NW215_10880 [Hyphomicrobiales bacterium]|nr:hypothetical protein [Hyphomicrobiales bacterium]
MKPCTIPPAPAGLLRQLPKEPKLAEREISVTELKLAYRDAKSWGAINHIMATRLQEHIRDAERAKARCLAKTA